MASTRDEQVTAVSPQALAPLPVPGAKSLNVANAITVARLLLAFVLFAMIYVQGLWLSAAALFVFAVSTDFIDGYIARRYGLITTLGRILDPFVDKIIVCGAFVFLLEKKLDSGINSWMVITVIGREMLVTSLRGFLEQMGCDFSATASGKLKMVLQSIAVTASLMSLSPLVAGWSLGGVSFDAARDVLLWTAVAVTIYSGFVYVLRAIALLRSGNV